MFSPIRSRALGVAVALPALLLSAGAAAQDIPDDQAIDLQRFYPATGPQLFLTVAPARIMPMKQFTVGFGINYMTNPLVVYDVDDMDNLTQRTDVVSSAFAGQLSGAYGLLDKGQLGVILPITFSMAGDGLDVMTGDPLGGGLSVTGFGDMLVEFSWKLYETEAIIITGIPGVALPTSMAFRGKGVESGAFLGDDLPSFRPRAAIEWTDANGKFAVGGNLGFAFRKPRTLYSTTFGQQITYGAAVVFHASPKADVVAELFGATDFTFQLDAAPLEADAAVRLAITDTWKFMIGGGAGVISGLGAPGMRVFASVSWAPDYGDSDGDGVNNMQDLCPDEAEDKDGYDDADGCSESDNDGDKLDDSEDKCKDIAEDKDGFEDDDGCPEEDNDMDGLLDGQDRCASESEDGLPPYDKDGCPATKRDSDDDGFMDAADKCPVDPEDLDGLIDDDGCPEEDADADGAPDEGDACPTDAEDKDGFEDEDGCAELDNDLDGYPDATDKCANERETVNGVTDDDGCPDTGGKVLARVDGKQLVIEGKPKWDGGKPNAKKMGPALDQVALLIRGAPRVKKWRVVVSAEKQKTDDATRALSQQRADAVRAYLISKGVPEDRIEAVGVAAEKPAFFIVAVEIEGVEAAPVEGTTEEEPAIEMGDQ